MPWHQNHDKSSKNTENLIKPWKTPGNRESHLTVDCPRTYSRFERLVCNQEVAGSIPVVSNNFSITPCEPRVASAQRWRRRAVRDRRLHPERGTLMPSAQPSMAGALLGHISEFRLWHLAASASSSLRLNLRFKNRGIPLQFCGLFISESAWLRTRRSPDLQLVTRPAGRTSGPV